MDETPYPDLPAEVRAWSSAHVAEYLGYSLRRYPRAITEDLGRYVRQVKLRKGAKKEKRNIYRVMICPLDQADVPLYFGSDCTSVLFCFCFCFWS